jgi:hypothetical protein
MASSRPSFATRVRVETLSGEVLFSAECDRRDATSLFPKLRDAAARHFQTHSSRVVLLANGDWRLLDDSQFAAHVATRRATEEPLLIVAMCEPVFRTVEACVTKLNYVPESAKPFYFHPRYGLRTTDCFPVYVTKADPAHDLKIACPRASNGGRRLAAILQKIVSALPFHLKIGGKAADTMISTEQSDGTHVLDVCIPLHLLIYHSIMCETIDATPPATVEVHVQLSWLFDENPRSVHVTHKGSIYQMDSGLMGKMFLRHGSLQHDFPEFTPVVTKSNVQHVMARYGINRVEKHDYALSALYLLLGQNARMYPVSGLVPFHVDAVTGTVRSLRQYPKIEHVVVAAGSYKDARSKHKDADGAECGSGVFFSMHSVLLTARADAPFSFCYSAHEAVAAVKDPVTGQYVLDGTFVLSGKAACLVGASDRKGDPLRVRVVCELYNVKEVIVLKELRTYCDASGRCRAGFRMSTLPTWARVPAHTRSFEELMGTQFEGAR